LAALGFELFEPDPFTRLGGAGLGLHQDRWQAGLQDLRLAVAP
jgi:hypothetical protein